MARVRLAATALERRPWLVLAAIVTLVAALAAYFTTQMTQFEPDEIGYTKLAIQIGDQLQPISTSALGRDRLNQLYPLIIATPYALFGNVTAYVIAHVINAVLMASSAIPAYLLARRVLGGARGWSYLFALLVAIAPWLTLSTVQLTEVAAFPASVWALWAMQRALDDPSPRRDVVALVLIGVASFGRLQLILFAPLFVTAVLLHEVAFAPREATRRLWQRHWPVAIVAALGVFVGVPVLVSGEMSKLFGFYGNTLSAKQFPPGTFNLARTNFVFMAFGIGALPAAAAIGFVFDQLSARRDRTLHAFAVLALLTVAAVIVQVSTVNINFNGAVVQERYTMFVAPPLLLAGLALLLRGRRPIAMLLLGAVPLIWLIATTDYVTQRNAFWYLVSPGLTTFYDVVAPRLGRVGGSTTSRMLGLAVVVAVGTLVLAAALRLASRHRPKVIAALGAGLVVLTAGITAHALYRVVIGTPESPGLRAGTRAGASWIDGSLPPGKDATLVASQIGQTSDARAHWWTAEFWNRRISGAYSIGGPAFIYTASSPLRVDRATGRLQGARTSGFVVSSSAGVPVGLDGLVVARSPDRALVLQRVPMARPRVRWMVSGLSDDGWMKLRTPARLTVFGLAAGDCRRLELTLASPFGVPAPWRLVTLSGRARRSTLVLPGEPRVLHQRVCSPDGLPATARLGLIATTTGADPGTTIQVTRVASS